jgi:hypothetical protein
MSLSAREQRALESIEDGLAESDPGLASLLGIFSRLASGEGMPVRNAIQPTRPSATDDLYRHQGPRWVVVLRSSCRLSRRLGWPQAALLLWFLISAALISVALALSNLGPEECVHSWGTLCAWQAPANVVHSSSQG